MKRLMKIDGDDVTAIVKALQLDVGFPHEYMDVRFELQPDGSAEFRLLHCGALMDVEPRGEGAVVMMCHRIEDPTFDATAVATNPRARMRPIHRPPRTPADRHPHCHWTIKIEPDAEPVIEEPLTLEVGRLPLAQVANERPPDREPGGWRDYAGAFDPGFRLEHFSQGTLVAALREFSIQTHLLASSADLYLSERHDRANGARGAREPVARRELGERRAHRGRARARGRRHRGGRAGAPAPSGAAARRLGVTLEPAGERDARLALAGPSALLDPDAPGWLGLLAAGEPRALEAIAQAVDPRARVAPQGKHAFAIEVDPNAEPVGAAAARDAHQAQHGGGLALPHVRLSATRNGDPCFAHSPSLAS